MGYSGHMPWKATCILITYPVSGRSNCAMSPFERGILAKVSKQQTPGLPLWLSAYRWQVDFRNRMIFHGICSCGLANPWGPKMSFPIWGLNWEKYDYWLSL